MGTHSNQPQFDGFSPIWLGLGFPQFQNTSSERVIGIYVPPEPSHPTRM